MPPKAKKKKPPLVWKRGEGWIQWNPPRNHPAYEEWQKMKEKHNESRTDDS